jgi:hypothetical protein
MKHYDIEYTDTWERRQILLNGMDYQDYLNSENWAKVKLKN